MVFYITFLRALAAALITNAHYTGVYPTDLIANGGLLGDIVFFAVSGFCLTNVKFAFPRWYLKRIIRIYPAVWVAMIICVLLGLYTIGSIPVLKVFFYPTNYHFVASIILLYIPYYAVMRIEILSRSLSKIMPALFAAVLIIYIFIYDKSYYHIDNVREPIVRFLFFQSMLLGAYFKKFNEKHINKNKWINWFLLTVMLILYFVTKYLFVKMSAISPFQIVNQIIIFVLLYFILRCFAGIDEKLEKLPKPVKSVIAFVSKHTLEIYIVQIIIIPHLPQLVNLVFPVNWLALTAAIIAAAFILHFIAEKLSGGMEYIINKIIPDKKGKDVAR